MKTIETLVPDIQKLLTEVKGFENVPVFAENLAKRLSNKLSSEHAPSLRVSNLGSVCGRKLWLACNKPEWAEPLSPEARYKFLYGDLIEETTLWLAREAGHRVEAEQAEVNINGVLGHPDAIIDGHLVDVKSCSTPAFKKFINHTLPQDDPFGYMVQLSAYLYGLQNDDRLIDKRKASFLAIDKTLGHIVLDTYEFPETDFSAVVAAKKEMLAKIEWPARAFSDEPEGKSGNRKLGVSCSYCPFKEKCWPGLRTFFYARGPAFLTHVARTPDVQEKT